MFKDPIVMMMEILGSGSDAIGKLETMVISKLDKGQNSWGQASFTVNDRLPD